MSAMECLFCSIIQKKIPAAIIDETDSVMVIKDINPKAPIHYLIIPKKHVQDIQSFDPDDRGVMADLLAMAQKQSKELSGSQAFRLVANSGADAGQCVFHLHLHFLAGKKMSDF